MYYAMSRMTRLDVKWARYHRQTAEFASTQHANPYFELIAAADAPIYLQAGQERVVLRAGEIMLLSPWESHRGWKPEASEGGFFWVQFSADPPLAPVDLTSAKPSREPEPQGLSDLRVPDALVPEEPLVLPKQALAVGRYALLGLFERLVRELERGRGYYRFRAAMLLEAMLEQLASELLGRERKESPLPPAYIAYRELVSHLDNHYRRPLTGGVLEAELGLNYRYLCAIFKKYGGMTIFAYVQRLRIQQAKHLLQATQEPIQRIAADVGLDDPYHFAKLFKKLTGETPTVCRNNARQGTL
ncbi:helix-turn-helix transcriptional regulator [Cohnella sp. GCM10020058]|uniref:helix-turn-helix transcriptional regulator n=1 Tax=Cohnella sp. GCM10020058 TaxID=3317330 RepID=UPI0036283F98